MMRKITCLACFTITSLLFLGLGLGRLTPRVSTAASAGQRKDATADARRRGGGSPRINFARGIELKGAGGVAHNGGGLTALASADFDSDGVPDLVVANGLGELNLHRGTTDTLYSVSSPQAKAALATKPSNNSSDSVPFRPTGVRFAVSTAPDFLFAGDFNADGHSDLLVASRGGDSLRLLAGNGRGSFARERKLNVGGSITSVAVGEIGRADGQTDVAVSVRNGKGASLLVFEHPEGAFKYKAEIFKLSAPAIELVIGQLDDDTYNDIALAAGDTVTVVHGRGQTYPFDLLASSGIKRPAAYRQTRQLPFQIAALAVGKFTERSGESLALLAPDGNLHTLASITTPVAVMQPTASGAHGSDLLTADLDDPLLSVPSFGSASGYRVDRYAVVKNRAPADAAEAVRRGLVTLPSGTLPEDAGELLRERAQQSARMNDKSGNGEIRQRTTGEIAHPAESRARAIENFLKIMSGAPAAPLANWELQTLASDARLSNSVTSSAVRLVSIRASSTGLDDLILLDSTNRQIQIVASDVNQKSQSRYQPSAEVVSLSVEANPIAVLPMRLNPDAMSDLVLLREGSANPLIISSAPAHTFVVTSTADTAGTVCDGTEPCALRDAIRLANQTPGADAITFNIGGGGVQTIAPTSELPIIQDAVTIDGTTQPGFNGTPLIELKGASLGSTGDGLRINGSGIVVRGLAINEFRSTSDGGSQIGGNGISIFNYAGDSYSRANIIEGNYLGLDPTGSLDKGNDAAGVNIFDSHDNLVGGTTAAARNVMSGNGNPDAQPRKLGAGLSITAGERNRIKGNFIGTDAAGVFKISNSSGVFFAGKNSSFGGDEAGAGNLVSGNGFPVPNENRCIGAGINVALVTAVVTDEEGNETEELVTLDNNFKGNKIGTTSSGAAPLGNCSQGIKFDPSTRTILGSITEGGRNTISGNNYDAVWCAEEDSFFAPGYCQITGNNIGTDPGGTIAVPNDQRNIQPSGLTIITGSVYVSPGVGEFAYVGSPGGTTQDGACTGFCNLISGNDAPSGVQRSGFGQVQITNNHIGTDRAGTAALPNSGNGVFSFFNNEVFIGAAFVYQDGSRVSGGNVISGNGAGGVLVDRSSGDASNTRFYVIGNLIGTSVGGANALPNNTGGDNASTGHGVTVFTNDFARGFIGNVDPLARNVVAGNKGGGIRVQGSGNVSIFNNYVGLNKAGAPLGNLNDGIVVRGTNTQVGGTGAGEANFIRNNGKAGVLIYETSFGISVQTEGIKVAGNSIADNGGLGIDLSKVYEFTTSDGVTPNDCLDADEGPNELQNFPELSAPAFNGNGTATVEGTLRSAPAQTFTIDFYANAAADPTEYGEGETHVGAKSVTTDGNGFAEFTFTSTATVTPSQKITATATDADGNTSEFSCFAGGCAAGGEAKAKLLAAQAPTCFRPIVVNITTDEPDPNTGDGRCDVDTSTIDTDQCSLRAAIQEANARADIDFINFDIPGAGGHTIAPATKLPDITGRVLINGASQPGYADGSPKILLSGVNVASGTGLNFIGGSGGTTTRGSTVNGLVINRWGEAAIKFSTSDNSEVQGCHIGFDLGSVTIQSGNKNGIVVELSKGVRIGGALSSDGNVISNSRHFPNPGQTNGIGVVVRDSRDTVIQSNKIGTSLVGGIDVPNETGIYLQGSTTNTQIADNLISGNLFGLTIENSRPSGVNNRITNNLIGTTASGMGALPNTAGIRIRNSTNNLIEGNTISGNHTSGVILGEGSVDGHNSNSNQLYNNKIGVGVDGVTAIPNNYGIYIENSSHNQIGAAGQPRNKISGNVKAGVYIEGKAGFSDFIFSEGNKIVNNDIGVSAGNQQDGIRLETNADSNEISGNTFSGNGVYGVFLGNLADGNSVHDNHIGAGGANQAGLGIAGNNNLVFKNEISGNTEYNIVLGFARLEGDEAPALRGGFPKGNTIYDNRITNSKVGIVVSTEAKDNVIGGAAPLGTAGNKISGHRTGDGIGILLTSLGTGNVPQESFPSGNKFVGNRIGKADPDALPNKVGMVINKAQNNTIGAEGTGLGNIFIANEEDGIKITGDKTKGNEIKGNFIGFDPANPTAGSSGNGRNGIYVVAVLGESIGNIIKLNRIGHNAAHGISVADSRSETGGEVPVTIAGNQIGVFLTTTGAVKTPNALAGIKIENSESVLIGSIVTETTEPRNVIAGNGGDGISITGADSQINRINHSVIGTDESGTANIGNAGDGVSVYGGGANIIGGNFSIGNTIAGNAGHGVYLQSSGANKIQGNLIGVFDSGNVLGKLPNQRSGVYVVDGADNEIGKSPQISFQNIIGGNGHSGVTLQGASTNGTKIVCNFIGTSRTRTNLGNTLHGVLITDGARNTNVGGVGVDTGNRIAFNGTQPTLGGVVVDGTGGTGNLIDPNEIFGNSGLGIDIGPSGHTPNDAADADTGPNNLQNYPELVSAQVVNNELVINYKVDSAPGNSDYGAQGIYVEFFRADAGGEGEKFLGSDHYTAADYNNGSPQTRQINLGNLTTLGVTNTDGFTATASDAANNTSEFTPSIFIIAPPPVASITPGQLLISELRLSGTTSTDEYIELYNNTNAPLDISGLRLDSVTGLSLTIAANKTLPAGGHYLIAHATGYTLSTAAAPDQTYNLDLPITTGLALFNPSGTAIDAVGFSATTAPHREGTTLVAPTEFAQYAFVRNLESGRPRDTDDNAADFVLVTTDPSAVASVNGDRLGAPGPENLGSHIQRNSTIKNMLIDPWAAPTLPPNRLRSGTPVANGSFGTLSFRRRVRNVTGASVTELRFRIVDLTTKGSPGEGASQADLRAVDSSDVEVTTSNGVLTVKGTLVGQPPAQGNGGGLNSTFVVTLPGGALIDGATLDVQLVLGVEQGGNFRFFVNTEAVTAPVPVQPVMKRRDPKTTRYPKK